MPFKLAIQVLPLKGPGPSNSLFPAPTYQKPQEREQKFLHISPGETTIGQLWTQIEAAYKAKYLTQSDAGDFKIKKLQDENDCDIDLGYSLADIFEGETGTKLIKVIQTFADRESSLPAGSSLRLPLQAPLKRPAAPPLPTFDTSKRRKLQHDVEQYQYLDVHPDRPVRSSERDLERQESHVHHRKESSWSARSVRPVRALDPSIEDSEDEREFRRRQHGHRVTPHHRATTEFSDDASSEEGVYEDEQEEVISEDEQEEPEYASDKEEPLAMNEAEDRTSLELDVEANKPPATNWNVFANPVYPLSKPRAPAAVTPERPPRRPSPNSVEFIRATTLEKPMHDRTPTRDTADIIKDYGKNSADQQCSLTERSVVGELLDISKRPHSVPRFAHRTPEPAVAHSLSHNSQIGSPYNHAANVQRSQPITAAMGLEKLRARRASRGEHPDINRSPGPHTIELSPPTSPRSANLLIDPVFDPVQLVPVDGELHSNQEGESELALEVEGEAEPSGLALTDGVTVPTKPKPGSKVSRRTKKVANPVVPTRTQPKRAVARKVVDVSLPLDYVDEEETDRLLDQSPGPQMALSQDTNPNLTQDQDVLESTEQSNPTNLQLRSIQIAEAQDADLSSPMKHARELSQRAVSSRRSDELDESQVENEAVESEAAGTDTFDNMTRLYLREQKEKAAAREAQKTSQQKIKRVSTAAPHLGGEAGSPATPAILTTISSSAPASLGEHLVHTRTENDNTDTSRKRRKVISAQQAQLEQRRLMMLERERRGNVVPDEKQWSWSRIGADDGLAPAPQIRKPSETTPVPMSDTEVQSVQANANGMSKKSNSFPTHHAGSAGIPPTPRKLSEVAVVIDNSKAGNIGNVVVAESPVRDTQSQPAEQNAAANIVISSEFHDIDMLDALSKEDIVVPDTSQDHDMVDGAVAAQVDLHYVAEAGPSNVPDPFDLPDTPKPAKRRKTPAASATEGRATKSSKRDKQSVLTSLDPFNSTKTKGKGKAKLTQAESVAQMSASAREGLLGENDDVEEPEFPPKKPSGSRAWTAANGSAVRNGPSSKIPVFHPSESSKSRSPEESREMVSVPVFSRTSSPEDIRKVPWKHPLQSHLFQPSATTKETVTSGRDSLSRSSAEVASVNNITVFQNGVPQPASKSTIVQVSHDSEENVGVENYDHDQEPARWIPPSSSSSSEDEVDQQQDEPTMEQTNEDNVASTSDESSSSDEEEETAPVAEVSEEDEELHEVDKMPSPLPRSVSKKSRMAQMENESRINASPESTPSQSQGPNTQLHSELQDDLNHADPSSSRSAKSNNHAEDHPRKHGVTPPSRESSPEWTTPQNSKSKKETTTYTSAGGKGSSAAIGKAVLGAGALKRRTRPVAKMTPTVGGSATSGRSTGNHKSPTELRAQKLADISVAEEDDSSDQESIDDSQIEQPAPIPRTSTASQTKKKDKKQAELANGVLESSTKIVDDVVNRAQNSSTQKPTTKGSTPVPSASSTFRTPTIPASCSKPVPSTAPTSARLFSSSNTQLPSQDINSHSTPSPRLLTSTAPIPSLKTPSISQPPPAVPPHQSPPHPVEPHSSNTKPATIPSIIRDIRASSTTSSIRGPTSSSTGGRRVSAVDESSSEEPSSSSEDDDDDDDNASTFETLADEKARVEAAEKALKPLAGSGNDKASQKAKKKWEALYKFTRRLDRNQEKEQKRLSSGLVFEGIKGGRKRFEELSRRYEYEG